MGISAKDRAAALKAEFVSNEGRLHKALDALSSQRCFDDDGDPTGAPFEINDAQWCWIEMFVLDLVDAAHDLLECVDLKKECRLEAVENLRECLKGDGFPFEDG